MYAVKALKIRAAKVASILLYVLAPLFLLIITELCCNTQIWGMRAVTIPVSLALYALLVWIVCFFIPWPRIGLCACFLFMWLVGTLNHFIIAFRGIPVMLFDVFAVGTAIDVAKSYEAVLTNEIALSLLLALALCLVAIMLPRQTIDWMQWLEKRRPWARLGASLCGLFIAVLWMSLFNFSGGYQIVLNLWDPVITYEENGFAPSFVAYAQFSFVSAPEGYDKKEVKRILAEAEKEFDETYGSLETDVKPNVISIMDEAFADLRILGPLNCNKALLSYYDRLEKDPGIIEYGTAYVSTYGGGTARTEFEVLSGYSMAFAPNTQPYSQYRFSKIKMPIENMEAQGYKTLSMHPNKASNYRRNTVYADMGFDDFLSLEEDYEGYESFFYRERRITDRGDFKRMTDADEATDEPLFIHNVTMQNHGGFSFSYPKSKLVAVDSPYMKYTDLRIFESLLAKTDDALEELIDYYKQSDEPTILCFYGDHLPSLNPNFEMEIMDAGKSDTDTDVSLQQKRYGVPYFIWANYEVDEQTKEALKDSFKNGSSTNYIGIVTRAYAGTKLSAFDKYMLLLRQKLPVISAGGVMTKEGEFHALGENETAESLLKEYEMVQYCGMFDHKGVEEYYE